MTWVRNKGDDHYITVGTKQNVVQLWDGEVEYWLCSLNSHTVRVGSLIWYQH